jgi:hypothetical protein
MQGVKSLVLYMIYYPPHLKYLSMDISTSAAGDLDVDIHGAHRENARLLGRRTGPQTVVRTKIKADEWGLSIVLAWIVVVHLYVILFLPTWRCSFLCFHHRRTVSLHHW